MLTTDEINQILMDVLRGREPTIKGKEADQLRLDIEADLKVIDAVGGAVDIPYEITGADDNDISESFPGHKGGLGGPGNPGGSVPREAGYGKGLTGSDALKAIKDLQDKQAKIPGMFAGTASEVEAAWKRVEEAHSAMENPNLSPGERKKAYIKFLAATREHSIAFMGDHEKQLAAQKEFHNILAAENGADLSVENKMHLIFDVRENIDKSTLFVNKIVDRSVVGGDGAMSVLVDADPMTRRAGCNEDCLKILTNSNSEPNVYVHEFGHVIETRSPGLKAKAHAFLDRRTQGETVQPLGPGYQADERGKRDKFKDPYVGKYYQSGHTEVISCGLGYLYANPIQFAQDDPDYFSFMIDALHGTGG